MTNRTIVGRFVIHVVRAQRTVAAQAAPPCFSK
jgi:hypothetical protein